MAKKLDVQSPDLRPYSRVQKFFYKPSKTRASEMPSTDLKRLVQRFQLAGGLPPSHLSYGDATGYPGSKLEAMQAIERARDAFAGLPLKVRQAVGHDPRNLEDWIRSNPQLAADAGLITLPDSDKSSPAKPTSSGGAGEGEVEEPA